MARFYILIEPWAIYVKDCAFFMKQGGHRPNSWGRYWTPVEATDIEHARIIGVEMRERGDYGNNPGAKPRE